MKTNALTVDGLARLCGVTANSNFRSVFAGLLQMGVETQLVRPINLVPYLAQISHESMNFHHDREIWGPTPAQQRYDIRTDLGNTPERDGDGKLYMGRTAIQITGRYNTTAFWKWCLSFFKNVPNFVENPDLMNTDPWEGLGPIWFWSVGNRTKKSLNEYAKVGNYEMITRIINGGLNGYDDRCRRFDRIALRFLGYGPSEVEKFQRDAKIPADGIPGPVTRRALSDALGRLPDVVFIGNIADAVKWQNTAMAPSKPRKQSFGDWFLDQLKTLFKRG